MLLEPTPTPEKLKNAINYKIVALIIGSVIIFQVFNSKYGTQGPDLDFYEALIMASFAITAIFSFSVSKKFQGSEVFGKAYLSLGLAYLCYFIGDIIWYYYANVLKEYPYPSISDIPYFAFYPFAAYHLIKNNMYFRRNLKSKAKLWLSGISLVVVLSYTYFSYQGGAHPFDYWYGMIFVAGNGVILGFTILGFQVFRNSVLGAVWGLLLLGFIFFEVGDTWYYHLEIYNQYTGAHVVNALYLVSNMIVSYALYKHRKIQF